MGASKPTSAAQSEQDLSEALDVDPNEYEWVREQLESAGVQLRSARLEDDEGDDGDEEGDDEDGDGNGDDGAWRDLSGGPLGELLSLLEEEQGREDAEQQLLDKVDALLARLAVAQPQQQQPQRLLSAPGADGDTALHLAALYGRARVARRLLDAGADAAAVNPEDGTLPLHDAAAGGYDAIVGLLLERCGGAGLGHADEDGDTPLHCAARGGHLTTVLRLLKAGADPRRENEKGCTARDESDDDKVRALLERVEAKAAAEEGANGGEEGGGGGGGE
jgi:hypothetical protein